MHSIYNPEFSTGSSILITGGAGFFGKRLTEIALGKWGLKKLIIFSQDELKQFDMRKKYKRDSYQGERAC